MPETDSINVDEKNKCIHITLNPTLYPTSVVMRASYRFIDDFDVIVNGDALSKIFVTLTVKEEDKSSATKKELEHLSNAFFSELIHSNVEESQARRYADTRNALIGAALRNMALQITPDTIRKMGSEIKKGKAPEKTQDKSNSLTEECKGCDQ